MAARTRKRDASGDSRGFSGAFMGFRSGLLLPRRATSACGATTAMHPHKRFGGVNGDGFWGDADGAAAIEQGGYESMLTAEILTLR
ncbi:hypothetical protein BOSE127_110392 [Bosea sp. 127]|nr:hypothetical protein BOSE7B_60393 [Bosea sp. 7B]VXB36482.1 hypothetical protein BOSE127_110392 [Bosea sp. 127]